MTTRDVYTLELQMKHLMLSSALVVPFKPLRLTIRSSRTHRIRTVSPSCEYAYAFSNYRSTKTLLAHITFVRFLVRVNTHVLFKLPDDENASRTHHIRTVSRSREYACGFAKHQLD